MRWWRHSSFARVVVVALLLWTAADLTNANLCALDNDQFSRSAGAPAIPTVSNGTTTDETPQQLPHVDDCFCCSHCVDVQVLVPAVVAQPIARRDAATDFAMPVGFGFPLYHPPLV